MDDRKYIVIKDMSFSSFIKEVNKKLQLGGAELVGGFAISRTDDYTYYYQAMLVPDIDDSED